MIENYLEKTIREFMNGRGMESLYFYRDYDDGFIEINVVLKHLDDHKENLDKIGCRYRQTVKE